MRKQSKSIIEECKNEGCFVYLKELENNCAGYYSLDQCKKYRLNETELQKNTKREH